MRIVLIYCPPIVVFEVFPDDLYGDGQRYAQKAVIAELRSDAKGRFSVSAAKPGVYLAMTRHRVEARTSGQPALSYTYSITFEVTD